jgi:PAS domain S-box-containing protein
VPEGVILTDARGTVTTMNGRAESMTGWAESEAVGQPITRVFRLVDARTHRPVVNPLVKALYKKTVVGPSHDALLVGKDGMAWQIHEKAAPICDHRGSVFAGAVAFRTEVL